MTVSALGGGLTPMEAEYGSVQAVILAGGEGSRLRPLTKNRPKVLLPAANRPLLLHLLDSVVAAGIRDITVVIGYKSEQVLRALAAYPINTSCSTSLRSADKHKDNHDCQRNLCPD